SSSRAVRCTSPASGNAASRSPRCWPKTKKRTPTRTPAACRPAERLGYRSRLGGRPRLQHQASDRGIARQPQTAVTVRAWLVGPRERRSNFFPGEPPRGLDLPFGERQGSVPVRSRGEPQHDRPRERPRLAAEVAHVPHRSEEHTSELQSRENLVCRLL